MENIQKHNIGRKISDWYALNGRQNLPWRENVTPYRVWISEIMLQQTQVSTAIKFFEKFMDKYSDLEAIRTATEDDIYALWSGLGYYRRASYIFKAKEVIHADFNGIMPDNFDDLMSLPGIGRSTAGAILSIAFNKPYPILDANVKKVISRIYFKEHFEEKSFWSLSEQILDRNDLFSFQQGVMDLGSQLCLPKNPKCNQCPINNNCKANEKGSFPLMKKKSVIRKREFLTFQLIEDDDKIFLTKTDKLGYWKNLWIPPVKKEQQNQVDLIHNLTHRELNISFIKNNDLCSPIVGRWFRKAELKKIAMPKPISDKLIKYG